MEKGEWRVRAEKKEEEERRTKRKKRKGGREGKKGEKKGREEGRGRGEGGCGSQGPAAHQKSMAEINWMLFSDGDI